MLLVNFSLFELYLNTLSFHKGTAQPKRIIWEVADTSRYLVNAATVQASGEEGTNFFSYESRLPASASLADQYEQMRLDLNRYFGMQGRVEKRIRKCWVLVRAGKGEDWPKSQTGKFPPDTRTIEFLVGHWDLRQDLPPVLDETGLPRGTRVQVNGSIDDMEAVRKSLKRYGLQLVEAEREIEVFVFVEKQGG